MVWKETNQNEPFQNEITDSEMVEVEETIQHNKDSEEIDLSEEPFLTNEPKYAEIENQHRTHVPQPEEVEQVMNNGLQFLARLFKRSTGKDIGMEGQTIEVNKETGEVTMKFKLPGFQ